MNDRQIKKYNEVMHRYFPSCEILSSSEVEKIALKVLEVAKNSLVGRSYIKRCHLVAEDAVDVKLMPESVGAHTNLMTAILDEWCGQEMDLYTLAHYPALIEAARRHDLPENVMGDNPDNGSLDAGTDGAIAKDKAERGYYEWLSELAVCDRGFETNVRSLLNSMELKCSMYGRALYCADKISATIMLLTYEREGAFPYMTKADFLTQREYDEAKFIRGDSMPEDYKYPTAEMWAADYFKFRSLYKYDDNQFFTAVLIAAIIIVHGEPYPWI